MGGPLEIPFALFVVGPGLLLAILSTVKPLESLGLALPTIESSLLAPYLIAIDCELPFLGSELRAIELGDRHCEGISF